MNIKKELKTNQIKHSLKFEINLDKFLKYVEKEYGIKIEGKLNDISFYCYKADSEIEITMNSIKEDRLKELVYDQK